MRHNNSRQSSHRESVNRSDHLYGRGNNCLSGRCRRKIHGNGRKQHINHLRRFTRICGDYRCSNGRHELGCNIQRNCNHHSDFNRSMRNNNSRQSGHRQSVDRRNHLYDRGNNCLSGCSRRKIHSNGRKQHINLLRRLSRICRDHRCGNGYHELGQCVQRNRYDHSDFNRSMRNNNSRQSCDRQSVNRRDHLYGRSNNHLSGCCR